MDSHSFSSQVEVLSVTDSGRRRRWPTAEKIRIVEESLSRPRCVAMTARRHDISRALLTRWRKDYREGLLGDELALTFAPVMIAAEPARVAAAPVAAQEGSGAVTVAITLVNGRQIVVPAGIDLAFLARLLPVLDGT